MAPRTLRVPLEARGERLDAFLTKAFPDLSRSRLKALIEEGAITLDGGSVKVAQRLAGGEAISLQLPAPRAPEPLPEDLPLSILFEDKHLVVLDKAAGMVVHPAAGHWEGTLVNALLFQLKGLTGVGGELRPGIVHRLDKDTSGALVVAKTEAALKALQVSFKARVVGKSYLALVHGVPPRALMIETLYGRHPVHRKRFSGKVREGKPAKTELKLLEDFGDAALVDVTLHTGRTHQIRAHLAEAGFPLLGDALYGGARRGKGRVRDIQAQLGRHALHAWRLSFPHPQSGKVMSFEAPLPMDLETALAAFRAPPEPPARTR